MECFWDVKIIRLGHSRSFLIPYRHKKRRAYFEEIKKYELYLIKKELGMLENNNENDVNKKDKKRKIRENV